MYLRQYHLMAKTMSMLKSYNLPGQGLLLQGLVSSPKPTQSCPPWAGLGLVHVRARVCIPLPQDRVHPLQDFHPLHWPLTDNISNGKREWVIFRSKTDLKGWQPMVVSLRNRTAGRRGRQNACAWQTWQLLLTSFVVIFTWHLCFLVFYKTICLKESDDSSLVYYISELTQQDGRKRRTAKRLSVTNMTGLLLACFVGNSLNIVVFSSSAKRSV